MSTVETEHELELDVEFLGVSIGADTCRVGVKVAREDIDLEVADQFFSNKRVEGEILVGKDNAQKELFESDERPIVKSVFDIKQFSVSPKAISLGMTASIESVDVETLSHFAKRDGRIKIDLIGDVPSKKDSTEEFEPDPIVGNRPMMGVDKGALLPIMSLERKKLQELLGRDPGTEHSLTKGKAEILASHVDINTGGATIGHLEQFMRERRDWHREVKGFGESWIDRTLNAHIALRSKFPPPSEEDFDDEEEGDAFDAEGEE